MPEGHSLMNAVCLITISLQQLYNDLSVLAHTLSLHLICISVYFLFFTHLYLSHLSYALGYHLPLNLS